MQREYHSREEALGIIGLHLTTLRDCYRKAWADWIRTRRTYTAQGVRLSPSLRARWIYDLVTNNARRAFADVRGVSVGDRGFLTLTIDNQIVLRFKKLKDNLTTSSIPTRQASLFESQGELPGLPTEATLLIAGYLLDPTGLDISRLVIVCRDESRLIWCHEVEGDEATNTHPMPAPAVPRPLPRLRSKTRKNPETMDRP
jgi:hypothetical protein